MNRASLLVFLTSLAMLRAVAGCGASVDLASSDAAGSGGSPATGSGGSLGTAGAGGCSGSAPECAAFCGSDFFGNAECAGGEWLCEDGWVKVDDCPPGTCIGVPEPCETCNAGSWACAPNEGCAGSCAGIVCNGCPGDLPGTTIFGACACSCSGTSPYVCSLAPGCCNFDYECGDAIYVPCAANVCKYPEPGGCWIDAECAPGEHCEGASVCPCGAQCDGEDTPGACVP